MAASAQLVVKLAVCGVERIANGDEWVLMCVIAPAGAVDIDLTVLEANPYTDVIERALLVMLMRRLDGHMAGRDVITIVVQAIGQCPHSLVECCRRSHASECDLK